MKHLAITLLALTLITVAGVTANSLVSTDQILVWSDFDGTGTNLLDERGRQNGTINGTLVRNTTDKPSGLPYSLTGSFSLANHAYWTSNPTVQDVRMNENKTIVIWFRNVTGTNRGMSGDFASPSSSGYFYSDAGGLMTVYLLNATANPSVSSTITNAQAGGWNMYGIQYNTTHLSMYLNGSSVGTPTSARGNYLNTAPRRIGYTDESAVNAPVTGVAQFIVINATLSTTQWTCLYNSGAGRTYSSFVTNCLATNLTITASDGYNGTSIQTFNASVTWNGTTTTYTTTTGTITTNITPVNATFPANVTLTANNYFTNTTTTTSTTLGATMTPWTLIRAFAANGTFISNYSVNYTNYANTSEIGVITTTNGLAYIPLFNATYNVTVFNAQQGATNYARDSRNVTANPYHRAENFTLFLTNTVSVRFYDEVTGNLINTTTVTALFTGTIISYNYTTTNGTINVSLIQPQDYVITYSASGYPARQYAFTLENQTVNQLSLFLLANATGTYIRFTVYDQTYQPLSGATINANKKNLSGTNYYNVQDCTTDSNGECLMFLETLVATYQFITQYGSVTRLSGDTVLSRDNYPIVMNIFNSTLNKVNSRNDISTALNYSGGTFTFTINDASNNVATGELVVQRRFGGRMLDVGSTTGSGSSFAISVTGVNVSLGDETIAYGYVYIEGQRVLVAQRSVIDRPQMSEYAEGFAFVVLGMIFTIVFIFAWNPVAPVIAFAGFLVIMSRIGFIVIGWPAVVAFLVIIVAVIYRMRNI